MKRASQLFDQEQTRRINQAVVEAETHTSAEIIPVVATASGRYDRPEDMFGLWLAILAAGAAWLAFPTGQIDSGSWDNVREVTRPVAMLVAAVVGFAVGAVIAGHVGWLRRLCTPRRQMRDEVSQRARTVFFDNRVHRTAGATGLVLYVSLYERRATVVADQAITDKLDADALEDICSELVAGLKQGDATGAICRALELSGQRLSQILPRAEGDANELPDALVILD